MIAFFILGNLRRVGLVRIHALIRKVTFAGVRSTVEKATQCRVEIGKHSVRPGERRSSCHWLERTCRSLNSDLAFHFVNLAVCWSRENIGGSWWWNKRAAPESCTCWGRAGAPERVRAALRRRGVHHVTQLGFELQQAGQQLVVDVGVVARDPLDVQAPLLALARVVTDEIPTTRAR